MQTVYFDYNATTPLDPQVRAAMLPFLGEVWGNPSSVHHVGRQARALLDDARERAAKVLGSKPSEIVFTGGGTESANLAILGTARLLKPKGRHIITSAIEHHAVLRCCEYLAQQEGFEVTFLPVDREGLVSPDSLAKALRPDTILVSVMAANNEIGTIQPVAELGAVCRQHGVLFHTDAVQWFGKEPFENIHQFNADLVSICAHKIHGPKGAGALFVRSPLQPAPILFGGSHENERRAGTENLAGIIGFVEALERFVRTLFSQERLAPLTERLIRLIDRLPGVQFVGSRSGGSPIRWLSWWRVRIASLCWQGWIWRGFAPPAAQRAPPGHWSLRMSSKRWAWKKRLANSLIRFSLGRESTLEEVEHVEAGPAGGHSPRTTYPISPAFACE